jgi:DNA-binding MltR family transcriptional regulator
MPFASKRSDDMVRGWFVETVEEQQAVEEMEATSDRAAAIVIASLVESRLTSVLQAAMVDVPSIKKDFFRSSGPLGSFAAKIDLALLTGLLTEEAHKDLHTMRRIRNEFAHELAPIQFDTNAQVRQLAQNFILIEKMVGPIEVEQPALGFTFGMRVADYGLLTSLPRGRYMLTGRLFVAGLDSAARRRRFSPDPWL